MKEAFKKFKLSDIYRGLKMDKYCNDNKSKYDINDVTSLGGRGDLPKAYLVKWVTRGREGSKISKNG